MKRGAGGWFANLALGAGLLAVCGALTLLLTAGGGAEARYAGSLHSSFLDRPGLLQADAGLPRMDTLARPAPHPGLPYRQRLRTPCDHGPLQYGNDSARWR